MTKKNESTEATENQDVERDVTPAEEGNEHSSEAQAETRETQNPNAEAKKYRVRLRDAEAERDQLERAIADLAVGDGQQPHRRRNPRRKRAGHDPQLRKPSDLYLFTQTGPADYIGDDGRPDAQKIAEAVSDLAKQRPELIARPERVIIPNAGDHPPKGAPKASFTEAFKPVRDR